jgi:hypothetical protein
VLEEKGVKGRVAEAIKEALDAVTVELLNEWTKLLERGARGADPGRPMALLGKNPVGGTSPEGNPSGRGGGQLVLMARICACMKSAEVVSMMLRSFTKRRRNGLPVKQLRGFLLVNWEIITVPIEDLIDASSKDPVTGGIPLEPAVEYCHGDECISSEEVSDF